MLTSEGAHIKKEPTTIVMLTAEGANQHLKKALKGNFECFFAL